MNRPDRDRWLFPWPFICALPLAAVLFEREPAAALGLLFMIWFIFQD